MIRTIALAALLLTGCEISITSDSECPGLGEAGTVVNVREQEITKGARSSPGYVVAVKRDKDATVCNFSAFEAAWQVGDKIRGREGRGP